MKRSDEPDAKSKLADIEPIHLFDNSNGLAPPAEEPEDTTDQENLDRAVRANIIQGLSSGGSF